MNERKKTTTDPELLTMARLDRLLTALDEQARQRVLRWLYERHGPRPAGQTGERVASGMGA